MPHSCYETPCNGRRFLTLKGFANHLCCSDRHRYGTRKKRGKSQYHCEDCDLNFSFQYALDIHNQAYEHEEATQFTCCDCERDFCNQLALDQHLRDKVHAVRKVLTTSTCTICGKDLRSESALASHMASSIHKNLPSGNCPACGQHFPLLSAMAHHLESGKCKSRVNKSILDATIYQYDTLNTITLANSRQRIQGTVSEITDGSDTETLDIDISTPSESDGGVPIHTPTSSRSASFSNSPLGLLTPSSYHSSTDLEIYGNFPRDANGDFICLLCLESRKFINERALQAHMLSPAHAPKIYKCPTNLFTNLPGKKRHSKMFTTLSGLTQHIESEACRGGRAGFNLAVKYLGDKFWELGFGSKWIDMGVK